ncbi:hypothetical protein Tco_1255709 [Tanacetum coccineum]
MEATKWDSGSYKASEEIRKIYGESNHLDKQVGVVSSKKKLEQFLKKLNEERVAWQSREHEKIRVVIDDVKSELIRERKNRQRMEIVNSKLVNELADAKLSAKRVKDKEPDVVKEKESFVVKDKVVANKLFSDVVEDRVLDDVVKDKESDVVKNVVNDVAKDVVSDVVLEQVVSNIKLSNVVSKKRTRRTELPKLNASAVADKHGVDVVSDNVADKTGVHQRFSGEVYGGPSEVVGFSTIVVVLPVYINVSNTEARWLLRFSGEGCGVSGEVFCVSGDGCCDSGEWVLVGDEVVLGGEEMCVFFKREKVMY